VREAIEAAGATLLYLPQYSPDLDPIELAFAKFKALQRKAAEPFAVSGAASARSSRNYCNSTRMRQLFQTRGLCCNLTGICFSPHNSDTGMILDLIAHWPVNVAASLVVGDKKIEAGPASGLKSFRMAGSKVSSRSSCGNEAIAPRRLTVDQPSSSCSRMRNPNSPPARIGSHAANRG
jgi:hypothetical protein